MRWLLICGELHSEKYLADRISCECRFGHTRGRFYCPSFTQWQLKTSVQDLMNSSQCFILDTYVLRIACLFRIVL